MTARRDAGPAGAPGSGSPGRARLDRWCEAHRRLLLGGVLALAVVLRVVYFVQLGDSPLLWQHLWPESDMAFFDEWGASIAAGDWLGEEERHPHHRWHREIATLALPRDAALAAELAAQAAARGDGTTPGELLWSRWLGGRRFHQEPAYAYLLGLTYTLLGHDVRWVFAWQMAAGLAAIALVHTLARRHFGAAAGVLAALGATSYGTLLAYEMVLLRDGLLVFTGLLLAWVLGVAWRRDAAGWWAGSGAASALAVLLKSTWAPFLLATFAAIAVRRRRDPRALARAFGTAGLAVALAWAPLVARNVAVGQPPLALSSVSALTFVACNGPGARAEVAGFEPSIGDVADIMTRSGGSFGAALVETVAAHERPVALLGLWARRLLNAFHWYESPQNANVYAYRMHAPVLGVARLGLVVIVPLALLGLFLARRGGRDRWPLELLLLVGLATLVGFSTVARYRMVFVAALLPFAAFGAVSVAGWIAERRWRPTAAALAACCAIGVFVARPLPPYATVVRGIDHVQPYRNVYRPLIAAARDEGRWADAVAIVDDALRFEPPELAGLDADHPPRSFDEAKIARHYAHLHLLRAELLELAGREGDAGAARLRGERLGASLVAES